MIFLASYDFSTSVTSTGDDCGKKKRKESGFLEDASEQSALLTVASRRQQRPRSHQVSTVEARTRLCFVARQQQRLQQRGGHERDVRWGRAADGLVDGLRDLRRSRYSRWSLTVNGLFFTSLLTGRSPVDQVFTQPPDAPCFPSVTDESRSDHWHGHWSTSR